MVRSRSASIFILMVALGGGGCRRKEPEVAVLPSVGALAPVAGNSRTDGEIAAIQVQLRDARVRADPELWARLGRALVRKARESGDGAYYARADDAAARALALSPTHQGGLQLRQAVLLNDHRFLEARRLADAQLKQHPQDLVALGTLGDASIELGDYEAAHHAYQQMLDIRPDLRSYDRGAWLRWISGDQDGAMELEELAVAAGSPKDPESRAFCRVQLGDMMLLSGRIGDARAQFDLALREHPGYAAAYAARGRWYLVQGKLSEAIADLQASLKAAPQVAVRALLVEALQEAGQREAADAEAAIVQREGPREDPRALALFLAKRGERGAEALRLAQEEAQRRPDIWTHDALAWAHFRAGNLESAWLAAVIATAQGTADPRLWYHKARIGLVRGKDPAQVSAAVARLRSLLEKTPGWDVVETRDARALLQGERPAKG